MEILVKDTGCGPQLCPASHINEGFMIVGLLNFQML